jgi:(2R)-ethylmalonyl-CoA mutase
MDVVYEGIRLTPAQIAASALQEGVHVIGLSILSGSHRELIPAVIDALRESGVTVPVVVGGIIPDQDVAPLKRAGVACVYTPKDFDLTQIMRDIVELVGKDSASGNGATMPNGNGSAADNAAASNGSGSGSSAHVA